MNDQTTRNQVHRHARNGVSVGIEAAGRIDSANRDLRIGLQFDEETGRNFHDDEAVTSGRHGRTFRQWFADFGVCVARDSLKDNVRRSLGLTHGASMNQSKTAKQGGKGNNQP